MAYEGEEKNDQFNVNQDAFFTDRQYHQTGQAQTSKNNRQSKTCYICYEFVRFNLDVEMQG
ncbi:BgTH12-06789 [Blumeria graminis f. sp. triticale]|uniref:BgTH12-06789 n=1 Tax=Blumeria graminis f. sp. triticale TaxID=1689686 RepID=A0A9W4D4C7_BLUGR|nr:BgTH12-06789 [Blumeria graminis f. sp. triticale]